MLLYVFEKKNILNFWCLWCWILELNICIEKEISSIDIDYIIIVYVFLNSICILFVLIIYMIRCKIYMY